MPLWSIMPRRILRVFSPAGRVVHNVLADAVQGGLVADDMFIIIALPHIPNVHIGPDPFGDANFEPAHDGTNGFRG